MEQSKIDDLLSVLGECAANIVSGQDTTNQYVSITTNWLQANAPQLTQDKINEFIAIISQAASSIKTEEDAEKYVAVIKNWLQTNAQTEIW